MVDKGNTDKHRTGITGNGLKGLSKVVEQSKWGHNTAEKGMENSTPRLHLRLIEAVRNSSRTRVSRVQAIPLTAGFVATGRTLTFNEPSLSSSDHAPADTTSSRSDGPSYCAGNSPAGWVGDKPTPLQDERLRFEVLDDQRELVLDKLGSWNWSPRLCCAGSRFIPSGNGATLRPTTSYEIDVSRNEEKAPKPHGAEVINPEEWRKLLADFKVKRK